MSEPAECRTRCMRSQVGGVTRAIGRVAVLGSRVTQYAAKSLDSHDGNAVDWQFDATHPSKYSHAPTSSHVPTFRNVRV